MEIFRTRRQYPAAPPLIIENTSLEVIFYGLRLAQKRIPLGIFEKKVKVRQLRVKPNLLLWSVEFIFWIKFLFLAFV